MADVRRIWADRIRTERKDRGWDKPDMARRLAHAAGDARASLPDHESLLTYVKRWERGAVGISERYRMLYAKAFGLNEEDLFGVEDDTPTSPWRAPGLDLNGRFTPDNEERLILAVRKPMRLDLTVVDSLATILAAQRRTEDVMGSAPLIAPVRAQLAVICDLLIQARGPIRPHVVDIGAQWAQFAGWLHAAVGDLDEAGTWFDRAGEWAAEVPWHTGASMTAAIYSYRGYLARRRGQIGPMIGQSQAAQRVPAHPAELTFAAIQEARGHAILGDEEAAERSLDLVDVFAAKADEERDDAPPWAYFHGDGFYLLGRGIAYRFLAAGNSRYAGRSIELLNAGLDGLGDARRSEWAAWFIYQLAYVHILAGNPDEACKFGKEAAAVVKATDAAGLLTRLRSLHARLVERWPTDPAVAELAEALR